MRAVIMAGGQGARLRPITCTIPKPMAKIISKPTIEFIVKLLKNHGITDIGITLHYLPNEIRDYLKDGKQYGVNIEYFVESAPLGTAGSVKACEKFLSEDFLVISGDCICDIDLSKAIHFHKEKNADATLILNKVETPLEYGVVVTEQDGRINRFIEKPSWSQAYSDTVNTGIYIIKKEILSYVPTSKPYDFASDLFTQLLKQNGRLFGYLSNEYWCDIGDLDAYIKCQSDVLNERVKVPHNYENKNGVFQSGKIAAGGYVINKPVFLGSNVKIGNGSIIGPGAVIGDNCVIGDNVSVKNSILYDKVIISNDCSIRGAVICSCSSIKSGTNIFEGAVIGAHTIIGEQCKILKNVKIWPYKVCADFSVISENIIWGNNSIRLFQDHTMNGQPGIDITPCTAIKIGMSLASLSCKRIAIAYNATEINELLAKAVAIGAEICGADVIWFDKSCYAIIQNNMQKAGCDIGICLTGSNNKTQISVVGQNGLPISRPYQRKLSEIFEKAEFNVASPTQTGKSYNFELSKSLFIDQCIAQTGELSALRVSVEKNSFENRLLYSILERKGVELYSKHSLGIPYFTINDGGRSFSAIDEAGQAITRAGLWTMIAVQMINSGIRKIALPPGAPLVIDTYCLTRGCEAIRMYHSPSADEDYKARLLLNEQKHYLNGFYSILYLLEISTALKKNLHSLKKDTPNISVVEQSVKINRNKTDVYGLLNDEYSCRYADGIVISTDKGRAVVRPSSTKKEFSIYAEASNFEAASELCEEIANSIK